MVVHVCVCVFNVFFCLCVLFCFLVCLVFLFFFEICFSSLGLSVFFKSSFFGCCFLKVE